MLQFYRTRPRVPYYTQPVFSIIAHVTSLQSLYWTSSTKTANIRREKLKRTLSDIRLDIYSNEHHVLLIT